MRVVLLLALSSIVIAAAAAEEASYPREVRAVLDDARAQCRTEGGGEITFGPSVVRKLDLTGDGRPDYIVDFRDSECAGNASLFCGTGGCDFTIPVAKRDGTLIEVFSDRVRTYDLLPDRNIRFWLHGSYCGGHGNPSCPKTHRISAKPFKFEQPK